MALKALMLRKKIEDAKKQLNALTEKDAEFATREAELEKAIEEAQSEEEQTTVSEAVDSFEEEKKQHEQEKSDLESTVSKLEGELSEEEKKQDTKLPEEKEEREEKKAMAVRSKFFGMNAQERTAFFADESVKTFLGQVRSCIEEKRALTNVGLTIPDVMLELIRENIQNYSKLYKYVKVSQVSGTGRANIMGTIPEGVWTEMCGKLNELDLLFNNVEVDGYKVGGFFAVCNAILEDSDINLASEIMTAIGQAIGYALDKAIIYGKGTKMPLGFVTRLAQTSKPDDYPDTARAWVDLHTKNIKSIAANKKGVNLFQEIVLASGNAKGKYSRGNKFWAMNETTYTALVSEAMSINAAGAIATGMQKTMPVIGGNIEILDFIPDDVIVGGYGDLYLLAERSEVKLGQSEHYRFIEDQTVFKGTARYDGTPVIAEGFVAIGINGTTPTANMNFAPDDANPDGEDDGDEDDDEG